MQTRPRPLYPMPVPLGFPEWCNKVLNPETAAVIRRERKMFILALGAYRLRDTPTVTVYPARKRTVAKMAG